MTLSHAVRISIISAPTFREAYAICLRAGMSHRAALAFCREERGFMFSIGSNLWHCEYILTAEYQDHQWLLETHPGA